MSKLLIPFLLGVAIAYFATQPAINLANWIVETMTASVEPGEAYIPTQGHYGFATTTWTPIKITAAELEIPPNTATSTVRLNCRDNAIIEMRHYYEQPLK